MLGCMIVQSLSVHANKRCMVAKSLRDHVSIMSGRMIMQTDRDQSVTFVDGDMMVLSLIDHLRLRMIGQTTSHHAQRRMTAESLTDHGACMFVP